MDSSPLITEFDIELKMTELRSLVSFQFKSIFDLEEFSNPKTDIKS
jgi:hypothetical protein